MTSLTVLPRENLLQYTNIFKSLSYTSMKKYKEILSANFIAKYEEVCQVSLPSMKKYKEILSANFIANKVTVFLENPVKYFTECAAMVE